MSTPTSLDALKYVCLPGIHLLELATEELVINRGIDEDDDLLVALRGIMDSMHKALQSQVPHHLTSPLPGCTPIPHSSTYEQARLYSDGSPVYRDEPCVVPLQDEDGMTHLNPSSRRVFGPLPGDAA